MSRSEQKQKRLDQLINDRKLTEALRLARQLLRERPGAQRVWLSRSEVERLLGQYDAATTSSHRALELGETGFALAQYARCLLPGADYRLIAPLLKRGLSMPRHETVWVTETLAACAVGLEAWPEAHAYYERLTKEHGTQPRYRHMLGVALNVLGDQRRASRQLKRVINQQPAFGAAYWSLMDVDPEQLTPDLEQQVASHAANSRLDPRQRAYFCHVQASLCHRRGQYDEAFDWYGRANGLRRSQFSHDAEVDRRLFSSLQDTFSTPAVAGSGEDTDGPVFVVGLPRSGTTLVEQLLVNSGRFVAPGELRDLEAALAAAGGAAMPGRLDEESVSRLEPKALAAAGREYLDRVAARVPRDRRALDKNPFNFRFIGPILQAVPGARVVHVRKSPLEAVFSVYRHLFASVAPWSYTLDEVLAYYRLYAGMMAHWEALYPDRVLTVDHEQLVRDVDAEGRRLYAHCGLTWQADYGRLADPGREIHSASASQVRQGIREDWLGVTDHYAGSLAGARRQLEKWGLL
ncbi:MAG: tetratricopeptide repeat-containing sulfotransferase family protein [Pseudomonadota bacterium]